ncbi:MAG: extracellular solute-binding protein [Chloroflexaceae bacterium]
MRHYRLILLCLIITHLSACSLNPGAFNEQDSSTAVKRISFAAPESDQGRYTPLIERFNADNPDMQVQFVSLEPRSGSPDDLMDAIVRTADTAVVDTLRPEDMRNGTFYDLTPLADADPLFDRADFYPGVLDLASREGRLYAIPRAIDVPLLAYNKDLWAAHNMPPPDPHWQWNDLVAAAEQLAHTADDTTQIYGFSDHNPGVTAFLAELAARDLTPLTTRAAAFQFDQPAVATALERVVELAQTGIIYNDTDIQQLIIEQQLGIWDRRLFTPTSSDWEASFTIGLLPYPAMPLPSTDSSPVDESYILSGGTQHAEAAWRWISFLSRQALDTQYADSASAPLPARQSVVEDSAYWDNLDSETQAALTVAVERLPNIVPRAELNMNAFRALIEAKTAVLNDNQPVDQALNLAQANLEQQVAAAANTPQPEPDANPIVIATPMPSVIPAGATAITFDPGPLDTWEVHAIAQEVNQSDSGIFVQLTDATMGPLTASADQRDCFAALTTPTAEDIPALLDLQPLIDADPRFPNDDYPPALFTPFQHQGGLYGLPYAMYLRMLVYNQLRFDTADVAYPTADWTLDDLRSTAAQLTSTLGEAPQYGFADPNPTLNIPFFLNHADVAWVTPQADTLAPNFRDPQIEPPLRDYLTLLQTASPHDHLPGVTEEATSDVARDLFAAGQVAMLFDFGFTLVQQDTFPAALAPPPLPEAPLTHNDIFPFGLFIAADASHPEACWAWFQQLSARRPALADTFPARISVAESEAFRAHVPASAQAVYAGYRPHLDTPLRAGSTYNPLAPSPINYTWFFQAINRALGGADLTGELIQAQTRTLQHLDCVRTGGDPENCAQQVDPEYDGGEPSPAEDGS